MTESFDGPESIDDFGADDYLDPDFHEVDRTDLPLNDNAELDAVSDDSALDDLAALDGNPTDSGEVAGAASTAQGSLFAASTGDPRVDGAVSRLADLATSDITEHPAVLEDVHRRLYDALADLDK